MTEQGGRTSHTAIISRSLEIPAVVGIGSMMEELKDEEWVILDALEGTIIINPDKGQIEFYKQKQEEYLAGKQLLAQLKDEPAMTKDHAFFELCANIGNPSDADRILNYGAEGIGLYRTEFLYMENSHFPTVGGTVYSLQSGSGEDGGQACHYPHTGYWRRQGTSVFQHLNMKKIHFWDWSRNPKSVWIRLMF